MIRSHFSPVALVLLLSAGLASASAQTPDQGVFLTRLGNDTVALERFSRSPDRLEGTRVLRSPRTAVIRYSARLNEDGSVAQFTADHFTGGDLEKTPTWSSVTEFASRRATTRFTSGGRTDTIITATGAIAMPMLLHSYALYEQIVRRTRGVSGKKVPLDLVYPGQREAGGTWISPLSADSVAINYFHQDMARVRIDEAGRLLGFDGRPTVLKVVVTRHPEMDVMPLARQFAGRDAGGRGLGPLSPTDSVHAVIGQSAVLVEYNRPARRGRDIFGGLVPWNQVWRTGANSATHFTTSRDLRIGSTAIKAGTYTLWTLPRPEGALLIINGQTGQWGTDYDARRDVARIPLEVRRASPPVERFTIAFHPSSNGAAQLRLSWDTTEWFVLVSER